MVILVIGDVHAPFVHKPSVSKLLKFIEDMPEKPTHIVQVGDLYDFYSFSRFPHNPDIISPKDEVLEGRQCAEEIWKAMKARSPKAQCYQILGNHCRRPFKRLQEVLPEFQSIFNIDELWKFPGVNTLFDPREELLINDIVFIHGHRSKLGDHSAYTGKKTVVGHSHRGGVVYQAKFGHKELIWELNVGYLADPTHEALKYSPQKFTHWTHGIGLIDRYGPRFIPL